MYDKHNVSTSVWKKLLIVLSLHQDRMFQQRHKVNCKYPSFKIIEPILFDLLPDRSCVLRKRLSVDVPG